MTSVNGDGTYSLTEEGTGAVHRLPDNKVKKDDGTPVAPAEAASTEAGALARRRRLPPKAQTQAEGTKAAALAAAQFAHGDAPRHTSHEVLNNKKGPGKAKRRRGPPTPLV